jgi:ketosteroid isomerase-like protein
MKRLLLAMALSAALASPARADGCDSLEDLRWLLGDWIAERSDSSFHETWADTGRRTFEGTGVERSRANGAVKGAEELRLVQMAGEVFYVSKVPHNESPIAFRLKACDGGRFVFENPAHDFPRRIEYRREADDRLRVEVSDGAGKGFALDFGRAASPADVGATVLAAEDARFAAMVAADAEAMRRWFWAGLHYVHSTGQVENRDRLIESIASGRTRYLSLTPSERHVDMVAGDAAVVRGRARLQAVRGGATHDFQIRYLAVYRREEGDWKLQAWQSLNLP